MKRRILTTAFAVTALLSMSIAPAAAHFNEAAGKGVGVPGAVQAEIVVPSGGLGHIGMECGASARTPLAPLGLQCPAAR